MKFLSVFLLILGLLGGCAMLAPAPMHTVMQRRLVVINTTPSAVLTSLVVRAASIPGLVVQSLTATQLLVDAPLGKHMVMEDTNNGQDFGSQLQYKSQTRSIGFVAIQQGKDVVLLTNVALDGMPQAVPLSWETDYASYLKQHGFTVQ